MKPTLRLALFALILTTLTVILLPGSASATPLAPAGLLWLADFSPFTSSPTIGDLPKDGQCVPGRFECRWGGDCEKVGDKCYNCIADYHWSAGMNTCYHCGEGQSLVQTPSGEWRCQG